MTADVFISYSSRDVLTATALCKALEEGGCSCGDRLNDRFRLLTGGSRTALPHQQTLRALIDWSYDLLQESEQALLCRCSVFSGGWTLEAAEQVCHGEGIEDWEVLDLITALSDKSLVIYEELGVEARYHMLETIRQYAVERLAGTPGGAEVWSRQHRDYFLLRPA